MIYWKRKLAAYLHDPPSKALDIRTHGDRSDAAFRQAGFLDNEIGSYFAHADHTAAAMDRLPFPNSTAGLQCAFDGVRNGFLHPLSGQKLPFHAEFKSAEQVFEIESSAEPAVFHLPTVGQVSDLPVPGVSDSDRGQRPLQPADLDVCPTMGTKMRTDAAAPWSLVSRN